jgi:hypothetical protein
MSTIPLSPRPLRSCIGRRQVPPRLVSSLRGAALGQIWNGI